MKTQTRPFTVQVKGRRKPIQNSTSILNWDMSDEVAFKDIPSRDIRESGSARASSRTAFDEASRVFGAFMANTASAAASLSELASAVFAPRLREPTPAPVPETEDAAGPQRRRILPSLEPASIQPEVTRESTSKRRASRPRKAETAQVVPMAPEVLAEGGIEAAADRVGRTPSPTPIQENVPEPLRSRRLIRKSRVPAGERWKRRRLPKILW